MPGALPIADAAPSDGALPSSVVVGAAERDFGVYVHVPFCRVRCGYCDFNTYTAEELRGAKRSDYASQAIAEIDLARDVLRRAELPHRPASTLFFGGGTPTMLPATDLTAMLAAVADTWGLAQDAEITTEANPDSVDAVYLRVLADAGFTRVSFGMQSAVPHVLATLERTHDPERVPLVVQWAREAGLEVSLDLIYGTPGESLDDWRTSLEHAIAQHPDHLSAYSLIVEDGTKLARQIRRGEVARPDEDLQADMYELADEVLEAAGYGWYEVSNWSRESSADVVEHRSRHNLAYWQGQDWWGIGPGAHSHVGGVRWWNVKHPAAYADRIGAGRSPGAGRETLDDETRRVESVLLGTRIRDGLVIAQLPSSARTAIAGLIGDGLVDGASAVRGTLVLTLRGRLLADAVVRRLLP
ncbi:radical SAM family heme chaperone HemW [Frigoribacterium sp. CG_9.8]|uniref:radical SAM family heme chaperone HemW n=1 Tax=Frigoribacterium sp. CG_9.8 TaxID=2787733 RepID=UPI0018CA0AE2|nr:radical SAM family heme chaperone HemW [Frigoribacterium sp. CG_9.8]MBG6107337.1 oxygen-independent coproporphyrinogen-3 oxidase [Frigoribacterium sp. CG_9.8]